MADVLTTTPDARVTYHSTADGEVSFATDPAGVIHDAAGEQARAATAMGIVAEPTAAPPKAAAGRAAPAPQTIPDEAPGAATTEDPES